MYNNSKNINYNLSGSTAPLAVLFMLVSMFFTISYLKNSFNQSAMEEYRYAVKKALYSAEAGLNEVGLVVLPRLTTSDTTLYADGKDFGEDENGNPIGQYSNIYCYTEYIPNTTRKRYVTESTGIASYTTPNGNDVSVERTVKATLLPEGFEEFMYFTNKEKPIGPGNTGNINFSGGDQLDGRVHTNGTITLSNASCPEFTGRVTVTHEQIADEGVVFDGNYTGCYDESFGGDNPDGDIIDTVDAIHFPPNGSVDNTRANADRVFTADDLIRPLGSSKKDTLIMTEIHFVDNGYYATQWWYNIPPVAGPPVEFDFKFDSLGSGELTAIVDGYLQGFVSGGGDPFDPETNTYDFSFLLVSSVDTNGVEIKNDIESIFETATDQDPHNVVVENENGTKVLSFNSDGVSVFGGVIQISKALNPQINYNGPNGVGFFDNEPVKLINTSATQGLADDVEWNAYDYFHDHKDSEDIDDDNDTDEYMDYCLPGNLQHFDFMYWTAGGTNCDIFNCPTAIYNSEYVYKDKTFYPSSGPHVIYVRGGQVLVRGTVSGQYTIVTSDYQEYRRHDNPSIIDRVWGNIWIIDDLVYQDSDVDGEVIQPIDGGTNNVLGLIAGGSVIVANTRKNGAKNNFSGSANSSNSHVRINAALMAMNGGFLTHYWQNSTLYYDDIFADNGGTQDCIYDTSDWGKIADGRGQYRNVYIEQVGLPCEDLGSPTGQSDLRGYIYLWGSIVQQKRGYVRRNLYGGTMPYVVDNVGYYKDYNYDYNLLDQPPPYYPDTEDNDGNVVLNLSSYGQIE